MNAMLSSAVPGCAARDELATVRRRLDENRARLSDAESTLHRLIGEVDEYRQSERSALTVAGANADERRRLGKRLDTLRWVGMGATLSLGPVLSIMTFAPLFGLCAAGLSGAVIAGAITLTERSRARMHTLVAESRSNDAHARQVSQRLCDAERALNRQGRAWDALRPLVESDTRREAELVEALTRTVIPEAGAVTVGEREVRLGNVSIPRRG